MTAMRLHRYPSPSGGVAFGKMGVGATMAGSWKNPYPVMDSCIAWWDCEWNAGGGKHTSERILTNLMTGDTVAIPDTGYTINDNYIISDETYRFTLGNISAFAGNQWTIETVGCCVARPRAMDNVSGNVSVGGKCGLFMFRFGGTSKGTGVVGGQATHNSVMKQYYYGAPADITTANAEVDAEVFNVPHYRAGTFDNTAAIESGVVFYRDGVAKNGVNTLIGYSPSAPTNPSYDVNSPVSNTAQIKWSKVVVHNRILTASEIAANYAIDKERFNLP